MTKPPLGGRHELARPETAPCRAGLLFLARVGTPAIAAEVQRPAAPDHLRPEIAALYRAARNEAAIAVPIDRLAAYLAARQKAGQGLTGVLAASVSRVLPLARLVEFGCINSPEADALTGHDEPITVGHRDIPGDRRRKPEGDKKEGDCYL